MDRAVTKIEKKAPAVPLTRVAAYSRVSTGKDAMLHSLTAQISYYSDYIQRHPGWLFCGVFSDEATTGTKEDRAGFQALLWECRAGNIDLVITKSISRFARNTVILLETVRELKELGITIAFEKENIDTANHPVVRFASKYFPVTSRTYGHNFTHRENGKFFFTPLFVVLLVIEFSDIIFAVDSIPAVFSVTQDPIIVYTSNIFAIMGLRSLFFLISNLADRFWLLHYGLHAKTVGK